MGCCCRARWRASWCWSGSASGAVIPGRGESPRSSSRATCWSAGAPEGASGPEEFLCFPRSGADPHYGVLLSWRDKGSAPDSIDAVRPVARWLARFDAQLMALNSEYHDKRSSGRLGSVIGLIVGQEGFDAYRRSFAPAGVSDDQVKVGVLSRKLDLDAALPVRQAIHACNGL